LTKSLKSEKQSIVVGDILISAASACFWEEEDV